MPVTVIGSWTYTANSASQFVIQGQTLTQGGMITAAGETVCLASAGSSVILMSGTMKETEIISEVSFIPSSKITTHSSGAELGRFADVWAFGVCLSAGLVAVLGL